MIRIRTTIPKFGIVNYSHPFHNTVDAITFGRAQKQFLLNSGFTESEITLTPSSFSKNELIVLAKQYLDAANLAKQTMLFNDCSEEQVASVIENLSMYTWLMKNFA